MSVPLGPTILSKKNEFKFKVSAGLVVKTKAWTSSLCAAIPTIFKLLQQFDPLNFVNRKIPKLCNFLRYKIALNVSILNINYAKERFEKNYIIVISMKLKIQ